jgi:hypothetical protein
MTNVEFCALVLINLEGERKASVSNLPPGLTEDPPAFADVAAAADALNAKVCFVWREQALGLRRF